MNITKAISIIEKEIDYSLVICGEGGNISNGLYTVTHRYLTLGNHFRLHFKFYQDRQSGYEIVYCKVSLEITQNIAKIKKRVYLMLLILDNNSIKNSDSNLKLNRNTTSSTISINCILAGNEFVIFDLTSFIKIELENPRVTTFQGKLKTKSYEQIHHIIRR